MNRILKTIACMALMTLICGCAFAASTLELPASLTVIREEAFTGDTSIETVIVPEGVTAIESKAFANSGLSLIQLPSTLKSIAPDAFEGVSGFKAVAAEGTWAYDYCTENNIPIQNWVQETPASHFKYGVDSADGEKYVYIYGAETQLADVVIPEKIEGYPIRYVNDGYFKENIALKTLYVPDCARYVYASESEKLISVSYSAITQIDFSGLKSLESVVIRAGDMSSYDPSMGNGPRIGSDAFKNCTNLKSVVIADNVEYIGSHAFQNCTSLTEIKFPKSIDYIDYAAFDGCTNLQKIEGIFPSYGVWEYTFRNCKKLESLVLPANVTSIDATAFEGCENLTLTVMPGSNTIAKCDELGLKYVVAEYGFGKIYNEAELEFTGYNGTATEIIIPSEAYGMPVTALSGNAFNTDDQVVSVYVPDGVISIKDRTFQRCRNLEKVVLPDGLTSIGSWAFGDCVKLKEINIPDTVTAIDQYAFSYCSSLEEVNIPDALTSIENSVFLNCSSIREVDIPEGVISIGHDAFGYCIGLERVSLPDGLTSIDYQAFSYCTSLAEINIPNTVTSIGNQAFSDCSFSKINLPEGLTQIGSNMFFNCRNLASVRIPDTVTEIGKYAFCGCEALKNVTIPASVKVIGYSAFNSNSIVIEKLAILNKTADITIGDSLIHGYNNPTIYCYRYSGADVWAQGQGFEIVYLDDNDFASVGSVSLPASMRVAAGKTDWIPLSIFPDLGDLDVTWISKNGDVAIVSNGLVTAKSKGEVEIMVMVGNKTATMPLTVYLELTSFDLSDTEITIEAGASYQLSCINIAPEGADAVFSYESSNTLAASVDANGMITASAIGDAVITVTSDSGVEQTCIVHVVRPAT